jgi:hypothetical protein
MAFGVCDVCGLNAIDGHAVYRAMLAFRTQVRLIVVRARQRAHLDRQGGAGR